MADGGDAGNTTVASCRRGPIAVEARCPSRVGPRTHPPFRPSITPPSSGSTRRFGLGLFTVNALGGLGLDSNSRRAACGGEPAPARGAPGVGGEAASVGDDVVVVPAQQCEAVGGVRTAGGDRDDEVGLEAVGRLWGHVRLASQHELRRDRLPD